MNDLVKAIAEAAASADEDWWFQEAEPSDALEDRITKRIIRAIDAAGFAIVPKECTTEMLESVRDWSYKKYGKPVGNDGARGCHAALLAAAPDVTGDEG